MFIAACLHEYTRDDLCCANVPLWLLSELITKTLLIICQQHSINCDLQNSSKWNQVTNEPTHWLWYVQKLHHCLFFCGHIINHIQKFHLCFPLHHLITNLIADVINGYCDDITPDQSRGWMCCLCMFTPTQSSDKFCLNQKLIWRSWLCMEWPEKKD